MKKLLIVLGCVLIIAGFVITIITIANYNKSATPPPPDPKEKTENAGDGSIYAPPKPSIPVLEYGSRTDITPFDVIVNKPATFSCPKGKKICISFSSGCEPIHYAGNGKLTTEEFERFKSQPKGTVQTWTSEDGDSVAITLTID